VSDEVIETPVADVAPVATDAPTRLVLVEDNPLMREALRRVIATAPDFELVGEAEETDEAVARVEETNPGLVLMDLRIPGAGGIDATRRIKRRHPGTKVVAWTAYGDRDFVKGMVEAGASGYLLKGAPGDAFLASLRSLVAGGSAFSPAVGGEEAARGDEPVETDLREALTVLVASLARELAEPARRSAELSAAVAEVAGPAALDDALAAATTARRLEQVVNDLLAVVGTPMEDRLTPDAGPGSLLRLAWRVIEVVRGVHPNAHLVPAVPADLSGEPTPSWALFAVWRRMVGVALDGRGEGRGVVSAEAVGDGLVLAVSLQHAGEARDVEVDDDPELTTLRALVECLGGEVLEVDLRSPSRLSVRLPLHGATRPVAETG
jgi:DNA-binding NarL/FixJ family response regulator